MELTPIRLFRRSPRFCTWAPIVFIVLWSTGRCDKSSRHRYDDVCWWLPALYHNKRSNRRVALDQLKLCIDDVLRWNTQNGLKCNPSKTEVIHFYSRYMPSDSISHLRVGTAIIEPVNEVRDLGITLDSTLTLRTHINNICRSGSLSLHELSKIRKFLSQKDTGRVVHAFISSKLDYLQWFVLRLALFWNTETSKTTKRGRPTYYANKKIWSYHSSAYQSSLAPYRTSCYLQASSLYLYFMVWPLITWQIC